MAIAQAPKLNFSDLTNGPSTGLGDGLGSGAIITLWGQYLGSSKGNSNVYFTDASGKKRLVAHHYYWRNADGNLPGAPANLYESHAMQEIAVSIPEAAAGAGRLHVEVNGVASNYLPFLVRSGSIFHVKPGGNNGASGTFSQPWATVSQKSGGALAKHSAGDLIYSHGAVDREFASQTGGYATGMSVHREPGSVNRQTAIVSYPGTHAAIESYHLGFDANQTKAYVLSKYKVLTGNHPEPHASVTTPLGISGTISRGIRGTAQGRIVANYVGDLPGRCPSSQAAAIVANYNGYDYVSNLKVYGNQIEAYGCRQTSRFHHTTYFSIRHAITLEPFEVAWNYLNDNLADGGLHAYDQRGPGQASCGNWSGPVHMHNNVVVNQRGAGVVLGTGASPPCWTNDFHIYNNVLVNTGRGPQLLESGGRIGASAFWFWGGGYTGNAYIYNNHIDGFGDPSVGNAPQAAIGLSGPGDGNNIIFENNVVVKRHSSSKWVQEASSNYGAALLDDIFGSNNTFFSPVGVQREAIPSWSKASNSSDPMIFNNGSGIFAIDASSVALTSGKAHSLNHDIYGNTRTNRSIGAISKSVFTRSKPDAPLLRLAEDYH